MDFIHPDFLIFFVKGYMLNLCTYPNFKFSLNCSFSKHIETKYSFESCLFL